MERYGSNTISIVEDLFFLDSEFIIKLLYQLDEENSNQHRWILALVLIDSFLSAFSYDLYRKRTLLNMMAESYKKQFGFIHHHTTKQLNDKCRAYRKKIENAMLWKNEVSKAIDIVKSRETAISLAVEKNISMENYGELQVSMQSLLTSLIHMTMNRWFKTKNRLHEMVIYEFLSRYYTSEIEKKNHNFRK